MSVQDPNEQPPYNVPPGSVPPGSPYQPVPGEGTSAGASAYSNPNGPGGPRGYPPTPGGYAAGPGMPGAPNPGLAALLGFIPGVGAMYNGQFAKGIAHIAIFAVFSSLSQNVNGIFGMFVAGWVFYMVFEAYQTARARRDGLPLPDPFGLNNIGERFGFKGNPDFSSFWRDMGVPHAPPPPVSETSRVDASGAVHYTRTDAYGAQSTYQVDPAGNVYPSAAVPAGAAGYPGATAPPPGYPPYGVPPAPGFPASAYGAPAYGAPPAAPYGVPPVPPYAVPPMPPMPPYGAAPTSGTGLPTGAFWLIGLGIFALLGSLHPFRFLEGEATGGLLLIGLSVFLFLRRGTFRSAAFPPGSPAARWNLIRAGRGAGVVFVVGLLTLLQGLRIVSWASSWPFLLIFIGVFILVERLAMNGMATPYPAGYSTPPTSAAPPPEPVVETSSPTSIVPKYTRPSNDLSSTEEGR